MLRLPRTLPLTIRPFSTSLLRPSDPSIPRNDQGSESSTPGWSGRPGSDHALHRDGKDAQSAPSQEARRGKQEGEEGSNAVSQKDERNANQRAKEEHPEAPGPVIGMNSGELELYLRFGYLVGCEWKC